MGTETHLKYTPYPHTILQLVKLNNPLMGTETKNSFSYNSHFISFLLN